jgi:hypothetical protein
MKREKRTWSVTLTIVDKALGKESFYPKCYTKSKIERFVRNELSDFDFPNVKVKNVVATEVVDDK